jgi:hypothetical protein
MRLLDWVRRRQAKPGDTAGERVNESLANHYRVEAGLPEQRKAWLIDHDGEKSYHDLNIQRNGEPHGEVRVTLHTVRVEGSQEDTIPEQKVYRYLKEEKGYLIYVETN